MNSTKDAGQKPFSFQIGKRAVIKDGMKALSECKLERLLAYGYVDCSSHHANMFDCFMNSISFASVLKACCL
ncbi:hypothetical protein F2Q69_00020577 [Brassica cretica]|uniref:Uncharacterized protein n=1 Tax=Brassica cretica TaxID=69181 RepID=A0A8S9N9J2_BRACR|nr:hypothetical protein F2Q69_00055963 [Brassica cretica]KAF3538420.1 hypothetical protein F2Q69_00020577 [Brassica cretica]